MSANRSNFVPRKIKKYVHHSMQNGKLHIFRPLKYVVFSRENALKGNFYKLHKTDSVRVRVPPPASKNPLCHKGFYFMHSNLCQLLKVLTYISGCHGGAERRCKDRRLSSTKGLNGACPGTNSTVIIVVNRMIQHQFNVGRGICSAEEDINTSVCRCRQRENIRIVRI